MQTKEYRTVDKSDWIDGEWKDEPDKIQWKDEETGLPCLIVRGPSGALCGYVGVSESHSLYKKDYEHADVECHGGLTFADMCADVGDESRHVCHVPDPGEPDHVWWFGFDCAHSWDLRPKYAKSAQEKGYFDWNATYRGVAYVKGHVANLAKQLAALA